MSASCLADLSFGASARSCHGTVNRSPAAHAWLAGAPATRARCCEITTGIGAGGSVPGTVLRCSGASLQDGRTIQLSSIHDPFRLARLRTHRLQRTAWLVRWKADAGGHGGRVAGLAGVVDRGRPFASPRHPPPGVLACSRRARLLPAVTPARGERAASRAGGRGAARLARAIPASRC